jgi:hypothetical protein
MSYGLSILSGRGLKRRRSYGRGICSRPSKVKANKVPHPMFSSDTWFMRVDEMEFLGRSTQSTSLVLAPFVYRVVTN